jgi:multicomponent Na+:H+ antiporter subunit F
MSASNNKSKEHESRAVPLDKMRIVRWIIGVVLLSACTAAFILYEKDIGFLYPKDWDIKTIGVFKYGFFAIIVCSVFCLYRVLKGPTAPDRAVSLDMVGTLIVGFCAILGVVSKRSWYIDIGIIWALQSFIGAIALAKYLEGRKLDE